MAALPYMPLYVADYLADAAHLTTTQHGAYLLLIMNYWQRGCPLPDDDRRLASIARLGLREWKRNRPALEEFFTLTHGAWVHSRIDHELARVSAKSLKSKKAAQASVERRFGKRSTDVEPTEADTEQEDSVANATGGEPPDPLKAMFDSGLDLLVSTGTPEKQARSLLGKWKKAKGEVEVLVGIADCRAKRIEQPVEWLEKRFRCGRYVSPSGYQYHGDDQAVMREAEKRADWGTYWQAKGNLEGRVAA
jgi:uncharacterized protein YdaU (DUF1376 family)